MGIVIVVVVVVMVVVIVVVVVVVVVVAVVAVVVAVGVVVGCCSLFADCRVSVEVIGEFCLGVLGIKSSRRKETTSFL